MRVFITLAIIIAIWLALWAYLRYVYFFRDPQRIPPQSNGVIVSPCDGRVIYIRKVEAGNVVSRKKEEAIPITEITRDAIGVDRGWLIGIYMSPLDVHFNYAPVSGTVESVVHHGARVNLPMVDIWEYVNLVWLGRAVNLFSKAFHFQNERNTIIMSDGTRRYAIVEIADKFVNKIDCFVRPGDTVAAGQKIGFIRRGSQVDLFVGDETARPVVSEGEHVRGAETVLFESEDVNQ